MAETAQTTQNIPTVPKSGGNDRLFRLYAHFSPNYKQFISTSHLNKLRIADGEYGSKHVNVTENGNMTFSRHVYVDDLIARAAVTLAYLIETNPAPDVKVAYNALLIALNALDNRAMKRHGYSGSEDEAGVNLDAFHHRVNAAKKELLHNIVNEV
jgi:hypothetical protein